MTIDRNELIKWLKAIHYQGMADSSMSIAFFNGTKDEQFIIIAGWTDGYDTDTSDGYLHSVSTPEYCMNVKIAINPEYNSDKWVIADFDQMNMPWFPSGDVFDTDIVLMVDTNFEEIADWLIRDYNDVVQAHADGRLVIE